LEQVEIKHATAGDIIGLAGFEEVYIGETLSDREERTPLQFVDIDPPTIRMHILVNDSPFAGREGRFVTARNIRERLIRETRGNVSLQVNDTETAGAFEINARGEMQIAILIEQMRREGYEVMVSRPEVIFHRAENGPCSSPWKIFMSIYRTKISVTFCNWLPIAKVRLSAWIITRHACRSRRLFRLVA
jgi:Predicted membrane GTPase involved in stress response